MPFMTFNLKPVLVFTLVVAAVVLGPPVVAGAAAQTAAPSHKHYDDSKPVAGSGARHRRSRRGCRTSACTRSLSSTKVERAQLFMNQGLNLTYGFNHAEAGRAFAEAARLDPSLAMAYWGQALVLGPNINAPMAPDAEPKALALLQKAVALKGKATPRERAYIDALAARYTGKRRGSRNGGPRLCGRDAEADAAVSQTTSMRGRFTPNR